ncbi:unnamed protein product [Rhizopus stolonifer]
MNYPELLSNDMEECDMIYSNESLPSSWSSHSSMNDYQVFQQSMFSPSFLDALKQEPFMFEPLKTTPYHHSPTNTTISSPTSNYDNSNLFQPIPEEEKDDKNLIYSRPRDIQTKSLVQHYLSTKQTERRVTILTSKVAQKSYGTEKRFLCPPPSTILSGSETWWSYNQYSPSLTISITGEKVSHQGTIDWYKDGTLLDPPSAIAHASQSSNLSGNCVSKQLHISDTDDKRKKAQVQVDIMSSQGVPLGVYYSKPIKVISKPSKKRQSLRNMDLCIHHGSTVALFNRMRSQTISTKYLGVSSAMTQEQGPGTCFVTRSTSWDPFLIWIVDLSRPPGSPLPPSLKHHPENPQYPPPPAVAIQAPYQPMALHYNQPIVLQCVSTGLVSPIMVIRRVDKGSKVVGGNQVQDLSFPTGGEYGDEALGDPVSQLHKVSFQIVQDPTPAQYNKTTFRPHVFPPMTEWTLPQRSHQVSYLACMNDVVGIHRVNEEREIVCSDPARKRRLSYQHATPCKNRRRVNSLDDALLTRHDAGRQELNGDCWTEDVSDAAVWTLVGTDSVSFCFSTTTGSTDVAPHLTFAQPGMIEGDHLSPRLTVWLGDLECKTEFKSRYLLSWTVPEREELLDSLSAQFDPDTNGHKIPILLVHQDGTIYNSQLYYSF